MHQHRVSDSRSLALRADVFHYAYGIWLVTAIVGLSSNADAILGAPSNYVTLGGYALAAIFLAGRITSLDYSTAGFVFFALVMAVAAIAAGTSGMTSMLGATVFVFASRGVKISSLARTTLAGCLVGVALVLVLVRLGVATDNVLSRSGLSVIRHSFGFRHPNTLGMILLNICLSWLVLSNARRGVLSKLPLLIALAICIFLLDSRSAILLITMTLGLWMVLNRGLGAVVLRWAPVMVGAVVIASLTLAVLYEPEDSAWISLNEMLSSRLSLAHAYLSAYGVVPFGQPIALGDVQGSQVAALIDGSRATVDVGYVSLLLQAGWVGLAAFSGLLVLAARYARAASNRTLAVVVVVFSCSGMFETTVYGLQYAFPLFAAAAGLSPSPKSDMRIDPSPAVPCSAPGTPR